MAVPVKAYLAATSYSTTCLSTYRTMPYVVTNVNAPSSTIVSQVWGTPMFFDPLGLQYSFHLPFYTVNLSPPSRYIRTNQRTAGFTPMPPRAIWMLANTFPAAYQQVSLRPSIGQLWPRSGALPY